MPAPEINSITPPAMLLRQVARSLARQGMLTQSARQSIIDDACAAGLTGSEARRIVDEAATVEAAAARARLAGRLGEREPPGRPDLAPDDDGLVRALGLCGWSLRWNTTAAWEEARRPGADEWERCIAAVRDDMMHACSKVATVRRGGGPEPWHIPGARQEARIIGVVARRRQEAGEPDPIFETVASWAAGQNNRRLTLGQILTEAGILHRYESHARAPVAVQEAAKAALRAGGWAYRVARRPGKPPAKLWIAPGAADGIQTAPVRRVRVP